MDDFDRRFGIESVKSLDDEFQIFRTAILEIFKEVGRDIPYESTIKFCSQFGVRQSDHVAGTYSISRYDQTIYNALFAEHDRMGFYRIIEAIFALEFDSIESKVKYCRQVEYALNYRALDVTITRTKQAEIKFYPKGEELLDRELVRKPLGFLNEASTTHFTDALKDYGIRAHVKSATALRRCLEEFLKHELQNTKGLKANITELGRRLKLEGRDASIRSIIVETFNSLDKYFNDNSKHNDGHIDGAENEYLIYQIGLLTRYIHQIDIPVSQ